MTQVFLFVGFGSTLDDRLNTTAFREWLFQMDKQETMPNLVLGGDTLIFALASTREEDVADLGVEKLPEEGVVALPHITQWVLDARIEEAQRQWITLRDKAKLAGFSLPDGVLLITTGETEG